MSRFQQGSLLKQKRKSGPDVWVFRWYDETSGKRTYKKRNLGTVRDLPSRRDAEQAVADFRANINVEVRVPITVSELIAHYRKHELTEDKKAFATIASTSIYLTNHIAPKWGEKWLSDVRTVEVEEWLHALPYAPATKSKIRNIMSAVFNHAIRYEWTHRNPITKVRASSKRLREPDVLTPCRIRGSGGRTATSRQSDGDPGREYGVAAVGTGRTHMARCRSAPDAGQRPSLLCSGPLRGYQNRSEPKARSVASFSHRVPRCLEKGVAVQRRRRFSLSVSSERGKNAGDSRHDSEKDHSSRTRPGEDHWEENRMAQLPSLSGDEPESGWSGPEDSPGTPASRELADHPRHLHASDLSDQA